MSRRAAVLSSLPGTCLAIGLVGALAAAACARDDGADDDVTGDAAPAIDPDATVYPPPRDDLVPAIGSDTTLELATWNVENFPKAPSSIVLVADLITSLELDVVAMEEIEDIAAWEELLARLPDHDGVLSTHTYGNGTYQKLGVIYRTGLVEVGAPALLFTQDGYNFPRPPLRVDVTVGDAAFALIVLHLKAGTGTEDRARRTDAMITLEAYVRAQAGGAGDPEIVVLGDLNEVLTSASGRAVFAPWIDAPADYRIHTRPLADAGEYSFIPSEVVLDHIITTAALDDELAGGATLIPPVDLQFNGYLTAVSDHRPAVIALPLPQ